jgi:Flp pilus assembly pilin Flp
MSWIEQGWLMAMQLQVSRHRGLARLRGAAAAQSTVEYALVGALVVIAAAGALTLLGGELTTVFTNISKTLGAASAGH